MDHFSDGIYIYQLLAENWPRFNLDQSGVVPNAQVSCYRSRCTYNLHPLDVLSFFDYILRNADWIPSSVTADASRRLQLRNPRHCWLVSKTESPAVRALLAGPPADLAKPEYYPFCRDIGMRLLSEANLDDLVDVLRRLPDDYPDPNLSITYLRRKFPRALVTLSRWVVERMNNLLVPMAADKRPVLAQPIPLIAAQGDSLRYVSPPEHVFFADDRNHSPVWRARLPFAQLDADWQQAARFLQLKFISKHVDTSCVPGMVLDSESGSLAGRFKKARPYLLALVNDQRPSATEGVARYLCNLSCKVVDSLVVNRRINIPPETTLPDSEAKVYLDKAVARRVGSAGRASRQGVLYVRQGYEDNYDLLAARLAEYIDISSLADAFVILLERGREGRLKYLATHGLGEPHVQQMRELLGKIGVDDEPEGPETEAPLEDLDTDLFTRLKTIPTHDRSQPAPFPTPAPVSQPSGISEQERPPAEMSRFVFPEFDLSQVTTTVVHSPAELSAAPPQRRSGDGTPGVPNWERQQRTREAYGERGEQLVKLLEIERLRGLGMPYPERVVRWLREEGMLTADHDLESKDLVAGQWQDIVIEVKATPATDFRMPMSREEIACAQRHGDCYRLYRVINVASASPQVYMFHNPYQLWQSGKALFELRDTYLVLSDPREKDAPVSQAIGGQP